MGEQQQRRIMIVTGANTGIGKSTALALAAQNVELFLACRSREKTEPVIEAIARTGGQAHFAHLDLADLESVRTCAADIAKRYPVIDGLVNNAGLAAARGTTKQGFELAFGVNHLGHFLLTTLLMPCLRAGAWGPARIVNVSSRAHARAKRIDWDALRRPTASWSGMPEYAVSKLCNVLFTRSIAAGKAGGPNAPHAYAVHPGVVASDIWRRLPWPIRPLAHAMMISNEQGATTSVHCALSPEVASDNGLYYDKCKVHTVSRQAMDDALADELWQRSLEWTRPT